MVTSGVFPTRRANPQVSLVYILPGLQFCGSLLVFERQLAVSIGLGHFEPRRIFTAQTGLGGSFQAFQRVLRRSLDVSANLMANSTALKVNGGKMLPNKLEKSA